MMFLVNLSLIAVATILCSYPHFDVVEYSLLSSPAGFFPFGRSCFIFILLSARPRKFNVWRSSIFAKSLRHHAFYLIGGVVNILT